MSTYLDYNEASNHFDDVRQSDGADIIAGLLHVHAGKPLKVRIHCYSIWISVFLLLFFPEKKNDLKRSLTHTALCKR